MHLLHVFPSFETGGQQVRMATLANRLGAECRHTVLSLNGVTSAADLVDPGVSLSLHPVPPAKPGKAAAAPAAVAAGKLIRNLSPDLLLTHNWGSMEWVAANRWGPRVPHIHFEDGFGPDESAGRQFIRRVLMRRLVLSGHATTVVPSRTLERIATSVWRLPGSKVRYIPNGIDLARFAAPPSPMLAERFAIQPSDLVVGSVGTLRPEKNFRRLIAAVAHAARGRPVKLVIVGDGPERLLLETEAKLHGLGDRLILTGRLASPEALLGRFDIFALSSDTEQMPYSLIEAMAASRPVVATDVGDVASMVADENRGFVVPAKNFAGFCGALTTLLEQPCLRRSLGEANREVALQRYDLDRMMGTYRGLFAQLTGGARHRLAAE